MKMAVARPEEIEKAVVLAGILEDLEDGQFPRDANGDWDEDGPDRFDEDNPDHVRALLERLDQCGGLWRVALGYAVLTDPKNAVIDPSLSHLELHPRLRDGLEAANHPFRYWAKRLWRPIEVIRTAWSEEGEVAL